MGRNAPSAFIGKRKIIMTNEKYIYDTYKLKGAGVEKGR
jgi:hypothetical protein